MKSAKKTATRKASSVAAKKAVSKTGTKKVGLARRKTRAKKASAKRSSGYTSSKGGVLVPGGFAEPVPTNKLKSGFANARKEINSLAEELINTMSNEFMISEIELSASFSADGEFLGIGIGGVTTIKIKISPKI